MTEEDKTNDSKKTRKDKNKKIIDVLMDDGEWRKRTKFGKEKKEQKPQPKPGPQPDDKTEIQPESREPQYYSEGKSGEGEEEPPEISSEVEAEEKMRAPEPERPGAYLSEIERNVLRAIVMGDYGVNDIIRSTNYPEVIVKGAIERLVSKDFIDRNLNPTEKIRGVSLKKGGGFTVGRKRKYRLNVIDVAIIVAVILFLVSLAYYTGFLG